jgi:predicted MFS family arabinose efflux permease
MGTLTTALMSVPRAQKAQRGLMLSFFVQGFLSLSYIPRIPELINQIDVSFAQWGLILGLAGMGGMIPLLFANRVILRWGTRPVMRVSFAVTAACLATYGLVSNGILFFIACLSLGFFNAFYNLALNSQAVMYQDKIGRVVLGKLHATWSIGATSSALVSGLLAPYVPLHWYLIATAAICLTAFIVGSSMILGPNEDGHTDQKKQNAHIPFFKSPGKVWLLAAGLFAAVFPEVTMMDWSAVFAKRELLQSVATVGIPYTAFSMSMIVGRLLVSRVTRRIHIATLGRFAALGGSIFMGLGAFIGPVISHSNTTAGLVVTAVLWAFAGLGMGPMVPTFFSSASSVKGMSTPQAMSRMSLVNSVSILLAKVLMGALAQGVGVMLAYAFPVLMFFAASLVAAVVARDAIRELAAAHKKASPVDLETVFPSTSAIPIIVEE